MLLLVSELGCAVLSLELSPNVGGRMIQETSVTCSHLVVIYPPGSTFSVNLSDEAC